VNLNLIPGTLYYYTDGLKSEKEVPCKVLWPNSIVTYINRNEFFDELNTEFLHEYENCNWAVIGEIYLHFKDFPNRHIPMLYIGPAHKNTKNVTYYTTFVHIFLYGDKLVAVNVHEVNEATHEAIKRYDR